MKILVIDDEKPTLSMFRLFLTAYGYDVYTAEDGENGLSIFGQIHPEIVFTDIKMPGMDGLEVLRRIKESSVATEVIIITGHGDMEKAVQALDLDASDFINKPVERKALDCALGRAEKRRQLTVPIRFACTPVLQDLTLAVAVKGKLRQSEKPGLFKALDVLTRHPVRQVVLSFDDSFSIDRSGIRLLVELIQGLQQKQLSVVMENLSCNYVRIFQMAGMEKYASFRQVLPGD